MHAKRAKNCACGTVILSVRAVILRLRRSCGTFKKTASNETVFYMFFEVFYIAFIFLQI